MLKYFFFLQARLLRQCVVFHGCLFRFWRNSLLAWIVGVTIFSQYAKIENLLFQKLGCLVLFPCYVPNDKNLCWTDVCENSIFNSDTLYVTLHKNGLKCPSKTFGKPGEFICVENCLFAAASPHCKLPFSWRVSFGMHNFRVVNLSH